MKHVCAFFVMGCLLVTYPTLAQPEIFNYKQAISGNPRTLSSGINSINRTTGEVVFGGGDSRGPTTPGLFFTWIWGDGSNNNGFFPQTKRYADVTKNYVTKVVATYSATEKDTVEVLVDFVKGKVTPIPLDPKMRVYFPSQPLSLSSSNGYGIPPALRPFPESTFADLSRAEFEYLFQLGATIEYDFVNEDVLLHNGKFEQYALRDTTFGGAYALWFTRPVSFGIGTGFLKGTDSDFSSMYHEMGHNLTLNFPAKFIYGGKIDGPANAFYSEAMAQIFQYAVGYEIINNYQKYGLDEILLFKYKVLFANGVSRLRSTFADYVKGGMRFNTFYDASKHDAQRGTDVFQTFLSVPYKFYEQAEQQGKGYRTPIKRLTKFLGLFNADWQKRYDQFNDTPAASSFRATLMVAAMSYAFEKDLRAEFRAINFPISDADWTYLSTFQPLPNATPPNQLLSFAFLKANNPTLTNDLSLTALSSSSVLTLPTGTSLTALRGSFVTSCSAVVTVGGVVQTSGVSVNDFSKPVVYQVMNGNAAPASYTIEVSTQTSLMTVENAVNAFMTKYNVPGMSVAITKDERLVYAKGYGLADRANNVPVSSNSLFRIASVSKPITAIALLKLVDQGKLSLDQKVFGTGGILGTTYGTQLYTPQTEQITVRHLLTHTAGGNAWTSRWDPANNRIDPFYQKEWLGYTQAQVISVTIDTRPVTETPGTKGVYSNVGVNIAGRIVEKIAGQGYERYVQDSIFKPLGIRPETMRIGSSTLADRLPNEVVYHNPYPGYDQPYDFPHARFDAHGGWVSTAPNLAWLMVHVDGGTQRKDMLTSNVQQQMITPLPTTVPQGGYVGFAPGWSASVNGAFWHNGGMAGTASYWLKIGAYSFAILINTRSDDASFYGDLDRLCYQMTDNLTLGTFMKGDQFDVLFPPAAPAQLATICSSSASLSATSGTICQGQTATLTASAMGGLCTQTYRWQRDGAALIDASPVMTVSAGGTYLVTVTESNGCPGTSASVVIAQKTTPDAQVAGVSVSASGLLSLSASPGEATLSHQWSLNGTALSGATSATCVVQQSGTYRVAITHAGCTGTSPPLTVNVPNSGGRMGATEPVAEKAVLTVSPNPSAGQLTIRLRLPEPAPATLSMTDLAGRQLRQWVLPTHQMDHEQQADLRGLPTGTYLIVADAAGQRVVSKILFE